MSQFVKNLAIAVFGIDTLKESSVTGTKSNRNKNKNNEPPRPALDSTKLQAIRGNMLYKFLAVYCLFFIVQNIFLLFVAAAKYYAMTVKDEDEVTADYEAQQIGTYISHKIYELNNSLIRKKKCNVPNPALICQVVHNVECTDDEKQNDNIPSNNDSVSPSVTEMNNTSKENVTLSDKECNDEESIDSSHDINDGQDCKSDTD